MKKYRSDGKWAFGKLSTRSIDISEQTTHEKPNKMYFQTLHFKDADQKVFASSFRKQKLGNYD